MNALIKSLNAKLAENQSNAFDIESELQLAWNDVFNDMAVIRDAVAKLECSNEYGINEYGDIYSWVRFDTSDFKRCQIYLVGYMRDAYCVDVDFENDTLVCRHGDDNIVIKDDTRHDNGVWQGQKIVIDESEYKTDGEIDETKRNALIQAHMKKTHYFPGVFRVDNYGNVFPVRTKGV